MALLRLLMLLAVFCGNASRYPNLTVKILLEVLMFLRIGFKMIFRDPLFEKFP